MAKQRHVRQAEFERMRRSLLFAVLALGGLLVVGTLGFSLFAKEGQSFVDALYMTVISLTTVGYGETIVVDGNPVGQIFVVALLLGGMGIVAYTVPLFAAFLIEGHLLNAFSRRRMHKKIEAMSGHYIVCGDSAHAIHVADELMRTGREVVLVVPEPEQLQEAHRYREAVVGLTGDPGDDEVLTEAGVQRAAGLVACLKSDKDNVIVALTARQLAPGLRIVASTLLPQNAAKLRTAGADAVVDPSRVGGLRMASELVRPTVVSFLDRMLRDEEMSLRVEEVVVPEGAPRGRTLASLRLNQVAGALVLAVVPAGGGQFEFNPAPDRAVEPGMTLVAMVSAEGRRTLEAHLAG